MKNMLIKVLSVVMALTMIMGTFATIASAYEVVDHKHVFDEKVGDEVPATCITPAYQVYECSDSDCTVTKTVATSGKLEVCAGPFETVAATDATCEKPGYLAYERCVVCGKATSEPVVDETKPALGHEYELVINDPTCGNGGTIYDQCVRCGEKSGYAYDVNGDESGNYYEIILPGDDGYYINSDLQNKHTCSLAGHIKTAYWYIVTKHPTCTETGTATFVCKEDKCDGAITVTINAPGHVWDKIEPKTVLADCEANGFRTYTCDSCGAVADAEHPELVDDVNAWLRKVLDLDADEKIPENVVAGVLPKLGHELEKLEDICKCLYGHDFDTDGYDPVTGAVDHFKASTCLETGYQWYHCVRDDNEDGVIDCQYGTTVSGKKTHYSEKEDLAIGDHTPALNDDDKVLYTYTLYVYKTGDFKCQNAADKAAEVSAISLAEAKKEFKNQGYDFDGKLACRAFIVCKTECTICHETVTVANGGAKTVPHVLEKNRYEFDANYADELCNEDATHWIIYNCTRCEQESPKHPYSVEHDIKLVCDEGCEECVDCTHAGRMEICVVCEDEDTIVDKTGASIKADHAHDKKHLVKTTEKYVRYTHPDFGDIYETCLLPAMYAWVCPYAEELGCEHVEYHYNPDDFTWADGARWNDKDDNKTLSWDEETYLVSFDSNSDTSDEDDVFDRVYYFNTKAEYDAYVAAVESGNEDAIKAAEKNSQIFCGDVTSRNNKTGHAPHAVIDANGNTDPAPYADAIDYKAPTCLSDGYANGICVWCGNYNEITIAGGEKYHDMDFYDEIPATCVTTGVTAMSVCTVTGCNYVKGGVIIPLDKSEKGHELANCTLNTDASYQIYGTCSVPYTEIYEYSVCKSQVKKTYEYNPANHNKYTYNYDPTKGELYAVTSTEWKVKEVALTAPTCTEAGNHYFTYCTECKYIIDVVAECAYDDCLGDAECACKYNGADKTNNLDCCEEILDENEQPTGKYTHKCLTKNATVALNRNQNVVVEKACEGEVCTVHNAIKKYVETIDAITMSTIKDTIGATIEDGMTWDIGDMVSPESVAAYYAANYRIFELGDETFTTIDKNDTTKNTVSDKVLDIPALGHDFYFDAETTKVNGNVLVVYLKETCTTPGHEWKIACSREDCADEDGNPIIHPELNGETIAPHGILAENISRVDTVKAPTCTEDGLEAGMICKLCDADDEYNDPNAKAHVKAHAQECFVCIGAKNTLSKTGHTDTLYTERTRTYDCENFEVKFFTCEDCGRMYGDGYKPVKEHVAETEKNADGSVKKDKNGNIVYVIETVEPTCTVDGYKYVPCAVCDGVVEIVETITAVGHMNIDQDQVGNTKEDYISFSCINGEYLLYKGTDCEICGHNAVAVYPDNYPVPSLRGEVICGAQNANIDHNWVMTVVEGGCTADGGIIYVCADCKVQKDDFVHDFTKVENVETVCADCLKEAKVDNINELRDYIVDNHDATKHTSGNVTVNVCDCDAIEPQTDLSKLGHDFGYTVEYVPATPEKNGSWTWVCARCGETVVETIVYRHDIEFTLTVNPYIAGKTNDEANVINFVNGGQIEVILSVKAEYYNFNTIQHVLHFNSTKLSFVELEYLYTFDQPYHKVNKDNVKVSGWFNFDALSVVDGDEVALVRYIFDVAPGVDSITNADLAHYENEIDVSSVYHQDELHRTISYSCNINPDQVVAVGSFKDYVAHVETCRDAECENALHTRHFVLMGDVNANGIYDIQDVKRFQDQLLHEGCDIELCQFPDMHDEYNKYNNVFDINYDGVIDNDDYIAFAAFQHSDKTVADYYDMFDADIASVIAAERAEIGDQDNDKDLDAQDYNLWDKKVNNELAKNWNVAVDSNYGDFTGYFAE